MRSLVVAAALVAVTAHAAHAGRKVKAALECRPIYDNGTPRDIPSAGKPRLDSPIGCSLRLIDAGDATYTGNVHTIRYPVDRTTGKRTKVTTTGTTGTIATDQPLQIGWMPGSTDDHGDIGFVTCEDFDVVATVSDDQGVQYRKTLHVAQRCPDPKPIKLAVRCAAYHGDDEQFDLPDPKRRSLDGMTIDCTATSRDARFTGDLELVAWLVYVAPTTDGSDGHRRTDERAGVFSEGEDERAFKAEIPVDDVPVCLPSPVELHLTLRDPAGDVLATRSISLKQGCH